MPQPELECHDMAAGVRYSSQSKVIATQIAEMKQQMARQRHEALKTCTYNLTFFILTAFATI